MRSMRVQGKWENERKRLKLLHLAFFNIVASTPRLRGFPLMRNPRNLRR